MPQHLTGNRPFASTPQLAFPDLAPGTGSNSTPPSQCPPLSAPMGGRPLDPCCRPPCRLGTGKQGPAAEEHCDSLEPPGTTCGWWAFTPECLQPFNTPRGVLLFLSLASFLQGMTVNGFINTVITSIERRFDLHSYQSGLVASAYDIAACLCLTFVSYFGGSGHKPRWLGWGVLLLGLGSFVFALPHFTTGPYRVEAAATDVATCMGNQSAACMPSASGLSQYRLVFVLGQFLHGAGATPLYTLGVTYLDENVQSSHSPVYIAIFYTAAILGPAAGYLVGGALLNIYTELGQRTELTTESPRWVGAWWIGFLGAGAAALLIAIPVLGFPRQLPGTQRYVVVRTSDTHQLKDSSPTTEASSKFGKAIRDLPLSVWQLLRNPTFTLLCLAGAMEATLIAGMSTFGPKFLESQFSLSASEAATLFGYLVVPAGGGGTFLGGFLVNKLKLQGSGVVRFCLFCSLTSLLAVFVFVLHCPNVPVAGVTTSYHGHPLAEGVLQLTAPCNAACACHPEHYNPVCGSDGVLYYSPCYAGCLVEAAADPGSPKVYRNCSCVPPRLFSGPGHATAGKCSSACPRRPLLLAFMFVVIIFTFLSSVPALTATLRCVSEQQRSFALGIQWVVVRTLGSIPGPIAFGWVIDKACLLWQKQCGTQGACFLYQNAAMSRYLLATGLLYKVLGFLCFLAACCLYRPPPGTPDVLDTSLPSQSSASDSPTDPQDDASTRQLQSSV
ncbi:solute carrier organic anion transporter family member 4A1 [Echinops telfairi]|uniref:Solute carrier organic anion transporter family member n=1 Tax=Echinops telfairi TaxID=9371 RepID=A0ABM0J6R0_ECHTE|nr:solute carrier organic anion transporter family member 4A1 [Echinops telfairi]